jgi:hypothetical protein
MKQVIEVPVVYATAVPNGTTQILKREGILFVGPEFELYHISASVVLRDSNIPYTDIVSSTGNFSLEGHWKDIKDILQEAMIKIHM